MKHYLIMGIMGITPLLQGQFSVDDLDWIVGSGSQFAGLVIDFNDGTVNDSFAWGFRFDGADVSGADMLVAVASIDPRLSVAYGGTPTEGFFLSQISYQEAGGPLHVQTANYPVTDWGYYLAGGTAAGAAISGGGTDLPATWTVSPSGAGDGSFGFVGRFLADGSWDYWSAGPNSGDPLYQHLVPPSGDPLAAPIPEPSTYWLMGAALVFAAVRRRKA